MTAVLSLFCLLAISSGIFARPQYSPEFRHMAPTPVNPRAEELPQTPSSYPPDDVEETAARKRNYQAAFANLASQMAAQSHIFSDTEEEITQVLPRQPLALQANDNLYHRNVISVVEPQQVALKPLHSTRRAVLLSSLAPTPRATHPQSPEAQGHRTYFYNRVETDRHVQEPHQTPEEPLVILPSGFLADTPEVQAAKREHLAAMARATAAAVRAESRKVHYAVQYRPSHRTTSVQYHSPDYYNSPQFYYDY